MSDGWLVLIADRSSVVGAAARHEAGRPLLSHYDRQTT
jgi:hypothetical protein